MNRSTSLCLIVTALLGGACATTQSTTLTTEGDGQWARFMFVRSPSGTVPPDGPIVGSNWRLFRKSEQAELDQLHGNRGLRGLTFWRIVTPWRMCRAGTCDERPFDIHSLYLATWARSAPNPYARSEAARAIQFVRIDRQTTATFRRSDLPVGVFELVPEGTPPGPIDACSPDIALAASACNEPIPETDETFRVELTPPPAPLAAIWGSTPERLSAHLQPSGPLQAALPRE